MYQKQCNVFWKTFVYMVTIGPKFVIKSDYLYHLQLNPSREPLKQFSMADSFGSDFRLIEILAKGVPEML